MADMIPRDFIDSLLAKIDVVDLISTHVPLKQKSDNNYFACCPFHQEKSASFSVSQRKQFYYCFGCGVHGNAIDFLMQHERLNFPDAIHSLARHVGMDVPKTVSFQREDSLHDLYDLMTKVAQHFSEHLRRDQRAIDYLKNRGISGEIARQFHLGYARSGWNHLIDALGKTPVDVKKLLDTGVIIHKQEGGYYDRFRDRIMFPIHDYRGRIIGFGGRILDQGEPKYLNSPETSLFQKGHELYGLYQALKAHRQLERVVIVEGYMDVIALFQHGITYAVATLGTATTLHHLQRLIRYTSTIIFCFDGDAAGRTAAWRALQVAFQMMDDHLTIKFLFLPEGEDPDSLIRKINKAPFEQQLESAVSLSEFFFLTLSEKTDLSTLEGRARLTKMALPYLKQLPTQGIFQTLLLTELSRRARIDVAHLERELKKLDPKPGHVEDFMLAGTGAENIHQIQRDEAKPTLLAPIRLAIALLIQYPELAELVKDIKHTNLPLTGYAFFIQLIEMINKNPKITTGGLIEQWRDQKEGTFIAKLARLEHAIPKEGVHNEFLGAIRQITLLGYDQEINRLLAKAAEMSLQEDEKRDLAALIAKKKAMTRQDQ